ncbi:MAG: hypothetical protein B7733_15755 [Myxococcales bacterium FL481]|nr:MAG: hypothetical protein B7733_15755 [Myxococcales bacterium FL481]
MSKGRHRAEASHSRRWFVEVAARQLVARLAALVPPSRFNMGRYRGVLAGRHHLRSRVMGVGVEPTQLAMFRRRGEVEVVAVEDEKDPVGGRLTPAHPTSA